MTVSVAQPAGVARSVAAASGGTPGLIVRLVRRELRSGFGGFGILIACIALGVAVITGVSALADALLGGVSDKGRTLLGGDLALTRVHQRASEAERDRIGALGTVGESAVLRSMARLTDGSDQSLIELKGVDAAYPLIGDVTLKSGQSLDDAIRSATGGAVVAQTLIDRLGIGVGDDILVGETKLRITDVISDVPDKLSGRLPFGPAVIVSLDTLETTGLVQPGSLISWRYAIANEDILTQADTAAAVASFVDAGFIVRDRTKPSPQIERALDRLRQFLILLGLAALLVGGVGVANAVGVFVEKRQRTIATYRSVGATSGLVFWVLLGQVLAIAMVGVAIGLVVGALIPAGVSLFFGDMLPVDLKPWPGLVTLGLGTAYGLLVAVMFTAWPLGQTEVIRPASLFRDDARQATALPGWRSVSLALCAGLLLAGLAMLATGRPSLALGFIGGVGVVLVLFWLLGTLITWGARHVPRPRRPEAALAIVGIGAPGGFTRSVIVSLGVGLSLLVAIALVDRSLVAELQGRIPDNSPDYFAVDVNKNDAPRFAELVRAEVPDADIRTAPMLRGRIVAVDGTPAREVTASSEAAWVLSGDRGLSFSETIPEGSRLVAGEWWPADHQGEPQVSFVADLARGLGLEIGDTVTVSVLGRNVTARITSLREIEWESLAINFVMIFSPNTLSAAPYNVLATVKLPDGTPPEAEAAVGRSVGRDLPAVTLVRVRDALDAFAGIFANVMLAIRAAGSVTLLAGALVLAGALATAQRRRILQAVILKCIGATRRKLLAAHVLEYGMLALIAAGLAGLIGSAAAWIITTQVLEATFVFSPLAIAVAVGLALALILAFGSIGTARVLAARPVPYLRAL